MISIDEKGVEWIVVKCNEHKTTGYVRVEKEKPNDSIDFACHNCLEKWGVM